MFPILRSPSQKMYRFWHLIVKRRENWVGAEVQNQSQKVPDIADKPARHISPSTIGIMWPTMLAKAAPSLYSTAHHSLNSPQSVTFYHPQQ